MKLAQAINQQLGLRTDLIVGVVDNLNNAPLVGVNVRGSVLDLDALASYTPAVGDNVAILRYGSVYLVLGAMA